RHRLRSHRPGARRLPRQGDDGPRSGSRGQADGRLRALRRRAPVGGVELMAAPVKPSNDVPDREAKRQLKHFRAQVEEEAQEHQMAYLNITPMMDMMTILLVFLLKQFSVQAASMSMSEGLQLPTSSIDAQRPLAVNVTIT